MAKRKIFFTFLIHYTYYNTKVSNKNYFSYLRNRISLEQEEEEEEERKKENRNTFPRSSRFLETISPKFPPSFHPSLIFLNFPYRSIIQFFPNPYNNCRRILNGCLKCSRTRARRQRHRAQFYYPAVNTNRAREARGQQHNRSKTVRQRINKRRTEKLDSDGRWREREREREKGREGGRRIDRTVTM